MASQEVAVVEESTTWDTRGVLTRRCLLENGDTILHRVTDNATEVTYVHADYVPKDMRPVRAEDEQRAERRVAARPMIAQQVLEYEQQLLDDYEAADAKEQAAQAAVEEEDAAPASTAKDNPKFVKVKGN